MPRQIIGDLSEPDWIKAGASSAFSARYAAEGASILSVLSELLERALPGQVKVNRRGRMLGKKTVESLGVTIGENCYSLADSGGRLTASRASVHRVADAPGEEIAVPEWFAEVGAFLDGRMDNDPRTREAVDRFRW